MRLAFRFVMALAALAPGAALACSCGRDAVPQEERVANARQRADVVFRGRVVGLRLRPVPPYSSSPFLATFEVAESFKGDVGPRVVLPSGGDGTECSPRFQAGHTYLVYAYASQGALMTDACTRTRELGPRDELELAWLRMDPEPQTPVALRRGATRCVPCEASALAAGLISRSRDAGFVPASSREEARVALTDRRPFWLEGSRDAGASAHVVVGRGVDGRAFEFEQSPWTTTKETCWQKVYQRACGALGADFECLDAGTVTLSCDEAEGRTGGEEAWESTAAAPACPPPGQDHGVCVVSPRRQSLPDAGEAGLVLSCRPLYAPGQDGGPSQCAVVLEQ